MLALIISTVSFFTGKLGIHIFNTENRSLAFCYFNFWVMLGPERKYYVERNHFLTTSSTLTRSPFFICFWFLLVHTQEQVRNEYSL